MVDCLLMAWSFCKEDAEEIDGIESLAERYDLILNYLHVMGANQRLAQRNKLYRS